jgi:hypothetical protein
MDIPPSENGILMANGSFFKKSLLDLFITSSG